MFSLSCDQPQHSWQPKNDKHWWDVRRPWSRRLWLRAFAEVPALTCNYVASTRSPANRLRRPYKASGDFRWKQTPIFGDGGSSDGVECVLFYFSQRQQRSSFALLIHSHRHRFVVFLNTSASRVTSHLVRVAGFSTASPLSSLSASTRSWNCPAVFLLTITSLTAQVEISLSSDTASVQLTRHYVKA